MQLIGHKVLCSHVGLMVRPITIRKVNSCTKPLGSKAYTADDRHYSGVIRLLIG